MLEVAGTAYASASPSFGITIPTDVQPGDLLLLWMGVPTTLTPAPPSVIDGSFVPLAFGSGAGVNGEFYRTMGADRAFGYANVRARLHYRFATSGDAGRRVGLDHIYPIHPPAGDLFGWAELVVVRGVNPTGDEGYTHPWVVGYQPGDGSGSVLDAHWLATSVWQRAKPFFFYIGANWYPTNEATPYPWVPLTLQRADYGPPFAWLPKEPFGFPGIVSASVVTFTDAPANEGVTMALSVFTGDTFGDDSGDTDPLTLQVAGPIYNSQFVTYAGLLLFIHDPEPIPDLAVGPSTARVIFE